MLVNTTVQRPVMTGLINLTSSTISHLHERNPPNWFNFISGGKDILISDMNFTVVQTGDGPADNTGEYMPVSQMFLSGQMLSCVSLQTAGTPTARILWSSRTAMSRTRTTASRSNQTAPIL